MQKWITFLMTFLVGSASYVNATSGDFDVFAGYRHDTINTKSRTPSQNPILKESTKFKDIDIFQIGFNVKSTIGCNFYGRVEGTFGWVLDGEIERKVSLRQCNNFDGYYSSSYGDTFETINEIKHRNAIDDRYVYDLNVAIGYPFYFCDCSAVLAPVVGYAVNTQNLNTHDNFNANFNDSYGDCGGCCKRVFNHRWYGPFVGVDFNYRPNHDCWNLYAAFEYHFGDLKVKRTHYENDDGRFSSHTHMDGWVVDLGADYEVNEQWTAGLYLKFTDFRAHKHHHRYDDYSYDMGRGKHHTNWHSYAINFELGRQF